MHSTPTSQNFAFEGCRFSIMPGRTGGGTGRGGRYAVCACALACGGAYA